MGNRVAHHAVEVVGHWVLRRMGLVGTDSGFQRVVAGEIEARHHGDFIGLQAHGSAEFTKSEQETLAIIAYKQPMRQSVLVKIRGNKAYDHIRNFVNLGLVLKKRAGHTWDLNLSEGFYDYFHVGQGEIPLT